MPDIARTLAAIDSLNQNQTPVPDYTLLETLHTRPFELQHDPLLARENYSDPLWTEIEKDGKLMLLFRWFLCSSSGRSHTLCPDSEIPALRLLLADVLSTQLPALKERAAKLLAYLKREGVLNEL